MDTYNKIMYAVLSLYIFLLPILPNGFRISKIPFNGDVILLLFILCYIGKVVLYKEARENLKKSVKSFLCDWQGFAIIVLSTFMLISISYAFDKKIAINETLRFLSYGVMFFIISFDKKDDKIIKMIIKAYVTLCIALSCFGIVQYFTGYGLDESFKSWNAFGIQRRIASTLYNPNAFGGFIILGIFPMIVMCLNEKNKKYKIIFALTSIILLVNMIATFSRNALIAFILGMALLCIFYYRKMIYVFGAILVSFLAAPVVRNRILAVTDMSQNSSRISLWRGAIKMIEEHPFTGVGNGNFICLYDKYMDKYPYLRYGGMARFPTHNSYLKVGSELGIIALLVFIFFLAVSFKKINNTVSKMDDSVIKRMLTGFNVSFIAFIFMNISDNLFFVPKVAAFFWIPLAISNYFYNSIKSAETMNNVARW